MSKPQGKREDGKVERGRAQDAAGRSEEQVRAGGKTVQTADAMEKGEIIMNSTEHPGRGRRSAVACPVTASRVRRVEDGIAIVHRAVGPDATREVSPSSTLASAVQWRFRFGHMRPPPAPNALAAHH